MSGRQIRHRSYQSGAGWLRGLDKTEEGLIVWCPRTRQVHPIDPGCISDCNKYGWNNDWHLRCWFRTDRKSDHTCAMHAYDWVRIYKDEVWWLERKRDPENRMSIFYCPYCGKLLDQTIEEVLAFGVMTREEVMKAIGDPEKDIKKLCGEEKENG